MRLFYALDIDDAARKAIGRGAAPLRSIPGLRIVNPELYHVTLMFFPRASAEQLAVLVDLMPRPEPLEFTVNRYGAFPSAKRPQTVWAGLAVDPVSMERIRTGCAKAALTAGFPDDRRQLLPHVTVARLKERETVDPQLAAFLSGFEKNELFASSFVSITLYSSELTPQGPVYTPRARNFPAGSDA